MLWNARHSSFLHDCVALSSKAVLLRNHDPAVGAAMHMSSGVGPCKPWLEPYLEPCSTGVGVAVGGHSPLGGWTVDAPMAESPAEEAGIRRGERILAVGAHSLPHGRAQPVLQILPASAERA